MLKDGIYEVMGNTVEVEGGAAIDLDANEELPIDFVIAMGTFVSDLE